MATLSAINNEPVSGASAAKVDMRFEVICGDRLRNILYARFRFVPKNRQRFVD